MKDLPTKTAHCDCPCHQGAVIVHVVACCDAMPVATRKPSNPPTGADSQTTKSQLMFERDTNAARGTLFFARELPSR
jgi:hypothetical protein